MKNKGGRWIPHLSFGLTLSQNCGRLCHTDLVDLVSFRLEP